jgi:uncharacterized protein YndB with AHSA1/START domain
MLRVDIEEVVERPIDQVFAQLVDIARYDEWMSRDGIFVSCTQDSPGPVGLGTRYTDRTRLGLVAGDVAVFEPPREVVFHYIGRQLGMTMIEGWPGYTLEPVGESATRVHHHAEARFRGPFRLLRPILQPILQRVAQNERQHTVDSLKRSLE